jgi:opacity protein-like surface antigen
MKLRHFLILTPIWFCQVHAAETTDWQYTGAVYVPLMGLDGTVGIGPVSSQVDIPFRDILKNLDAGLTGTFEARRNRWSVTGDFIWIKLSASVEPTPLSDVNLKEEELMASLALGYEIYGNKQTTFDLMAGAALTSIDTELDLFTPSLGTTQRSTSGSQSWVDPFVGLRLRHRLSDHWGIFVTSLYGGFGVASDQYWQALAGFSYRINESVAVALAYRIIATDYQNGAFLYDVKTSGPNLGVVFRF